MDNLEIADVLDQVHDLLLIEGRCKGSGEDNGSYCLQGAIQKVMGRDPRAWVGLTLEDPVLAALSLFLAEHLDEYDTPWSQAYRSLVWERGWVWPYVWNDDVDDDAVFDALRRCSKSLREEAPEPSVCLVCAGAGEGWDPVGLRFRRCSKCGGSGRVDSGRVLLLGDEA